MPSEKHSLPGFDVSPFDDIRPYRDEEVSAVLARVLNSPELITALLRFRFPALPAWALNIFKPVLRWQLQRQTRGVQDVKGFQAIIEAYMQRMINSTTTALTVSGLERLDPHQAYLFVSNHRDIAMDPAFVNWVLWHNGMDTVRIAIGDNLLTKPFASDLMRLNKSFLVKRGETAPKKIYVALKQLSAYIHHSVVNEKASVWIAQREGRAKDGLDRTEEAIIKMFAISKPKEQEFEDFVRELNIVPVAISYEWDPCDIAKSRELYEKATHGSYQKDTHEDVQSIAAGIAGHKGRVHVSFGEVLRADFENAEAVAKEIDRQILANYHLWPSNYLAYAAQGGSVADLLASGFVNGIDKQTVEKQQFDQRLTDCPESYRAHWLAMYANPVSSHLNQERPL